MASEMEKVSWSIQTVDSMKENGLKTQEMEKDLKGILMRILTMASLSMEELMVKESIHGRMERSMMDNGIKAWNKDKESGKELRMTLTLVNGRILKLMDMESIDGLMVIDMKDSGKKVWNMELVLILFQMENPSMVILSMENSTEKGNINGQEANII